MGKPTVILVTGLPGTGKTTLARYLATHYTLPVLYKDGFKETLFDALGVGDVEMSRRLGRASMLLLYHMAETLLAVGLSFIVEANFEPQLATEPWLQLKQRYDFEPLQIQCCTRGEVLMQRVVARAASGERHPGHHDLRYIRESPAKLLAGRMANLAIGGQAVEVDTTDFNHLNYGIIHDVVESALAGRQTACCPTRLEGSGATMMREVTPPLWTQSGWREQVHAWIEAELGRRNRRVIGPVEQPHIRPWSTVLRVPTDEGDLYFKAVAPMLTHEPALTQALARWYPAQGLPVLAADVARGWMLMPDGGTRLREVIRAEQSQERWQTLLTRYATLQIDLAARTHQLLALGVPDRRLATLPAHYRQLLADTSLLGVGQENGLADEEKQALHDLAPRVEALCEQLADFRVPESLNHGDLHDGNVFLQGDESLIFDWGDGAVTHPFVSLRTAFVSIENTFGLEEDDPLFGQLRDIYLGAWAAYEPLDRLQRAFELSRPLATLVSALGWYRVVSQLAGTDGADHTPAIFSLLREFLEWEPRV